ncbi:squalene synthase HpnC [Streptomyces sp. TRM 70351]|uniref:squalene synthase HpnC n=1 Tax=Streptomyces sp. TRM 70351 TaxID=3116552 RepID=UPI002E7AD8D1|nr:squalene synthase HpnC [Streptomyces sp. TRM 70351]MEE1927004.1 squalene synthase HpnC [Streptomyces sp. TRM 70351]
MLIKVETDRDGYDGRTAVTAGPAATPGSAATGPAAADPQPSGAQAADPVAAVLGKAARENFPVAPRFLPAAWRDGLMAVYGYARLVDDAGDGDLAPGGGDARLLGVEPGRAGDRLALLDALEADVHRAFAAAGDDAAGPPRHPLLRALVPVVRRHRLTPAPFLDLLAANRLDQRVHRYATWADLEGYCALSANPVGRLVLAVTGTTTPGRVRRSDAVCTALQIVEHLQDVAEDRARGRIYLPAEYLERFGVRERDLAAPVAGAGLRTAVATMAERSATLLDEGVPLTASVSGRLRLLLAAFTGGGRAALRALAAARYDVLAGPPRAGRPTLLRETTAVLTAARRGNLR